MKNSRNLLAFLYYLPPLPGTAPLRNQSMLRNLSTHMHTMHVFSTASTITMTEEANTDNCSHYSIPSADYRSLVQKMTPDGHLKERGKDNFLVQLVIKLINSFPLNLLFGEGGGYYLFQCIRRGKRVVVENNITHLYSSYRPMTDHFTAYRLKRKFPHLYWIADCRDLPVEPHYKQQFWPGWHHFIYKKILGTADVVTTISEGYADQLKRYHPSSIAVKNGLPDDFSFPPPVTTTQFTMVYTGSMFKQERNAAPVFKAIKYLQKEGTIRLEDIRIIYAGKDGREWLQLAHQYDLTGIFEDRGVIDKEAAKTLQTNANINLLLTMASPEVQGVLTGKLIEYLATGLPILCVVKNYRDRGLEEIFASLDAGLCVTDTEDYGAAVAKFIKEQYQYWCETGCNRIVINHAKLMERFSNRVTMLSLLSFLNETS